MNLHKILQIRSLTESAYVLRFERKNIDFVPGQHICVGIPEDDDRPYSIYSGINDDYIEILIKEIENGNISKKLKKLTAGAYVTVEAPHGFFCIQEKIAQNPEFIFLVTGTGISPIHSFVKSYPELSCTIIHGVRTGNEAYEANTYSKEQYILCTTRDDTGNFHGRITNYLKEKSLNSEAYYYLCGNSEMVDEVFDILEEKGISRKMIKTEIYF